MSSFRHTASRLVRSLACAAGTSLALVIAMYMPTAANAAEPATAEEAVVAAPVVASEKVNAEMAACPGQLFVQPFSELGDSNWYTLVEGSESAAAGEGWELSGGAHVVEGTRPDGSTGGVFDLPSGSVAVSPPTCVTLLYPTARAWLQNVEGAGAVHVEVDYGSGGRQVGSLKAGRSWELSVPFNVKPKLGGKEEGVREVRFVFSNNSARNDYHLGGVYVDPRLGH